MVVKKTVAKKPVAKKETAKKAPLRKTPLKKTTAKKLHAKKAPAKAKALTQQAQRKASLGRVSQEQARTIIIETAISLLRDQPVSEVSSREIAHETGLNHSYITRYFGGSHEMLFSVVAELSRRLTRHGDAADIHGYVSDPDASLRVKIVQYLLAEGFDPTRFVELSTIQLTRSEDFFSEAFGLGKRAARAYRAKVALLLLMADPKLQLASQVDQKTVHDVITLVISELTNAKSQAEKLGWQ
jgi:AcrR family transcriptional regulator